MNLISCQHCGVILDKDVLHFDEWEDYVPATAVWDGEDYIPTAKCPCCHSRVAKR